jgi:hypothetical protein
MLTEFEKLHAPTTAGVPSKSRDRKKGYGGGLGIVFFLTPWLPAAPREEQTMKEQDQDEQLANVLDSFTQLRTGKRMSRRGVLAAMDFAEDAIIRLLADTSEAEGVADMLQDHIDRVTAANRKLAQLAACFTGAGRYGTA